MRRFTDNMSLYIRHTILAICTIALTSTAVAQPSGNDTIMLGGYTIDGSVHPMVYMDDVYVVDKLPRKWARKRAKYNKLKHNIYKVYPYAVVAADILKDVDSVLLAIGDDRRRRKDYLKSIEDELKKEFKGEISDMTVSQGHVLVKLIDRQTGKSCYHIVKELKGGVPAVIYQSIGLIFSHNLKKEYDPTGDDADMEEIVRELEQAQNYQHQYRLQQARLKISQNTQ